MESPVETQYGLSSLSGQSIDNTRQLRIGARDQTGDEIYFDGVIDDVRVYARAMMCWTAMVNLSSGVKSWLGVLKLVRSES